METKLSYGGRPVIPPKGHPNAPVYVIGKCPSIEESRQRTPMVGPDGQTIFTALERAGILRSDCRVANVVWVQPPNKDNLSSIEQYGIYSDHFYDELTKDILKTKPRVILAVGKEACSFATGRSEILKWRGSPLPFLHDSSITVIPTILPSYIRKGNWAMLLALRSDCKKAFRVWRGLYKKREREFLHVSGGATFLDFRDYLLSTREQTGFLSYDIEGWYPRLACISFSSNPSFAVSIPLNGTFPPIQEDELRDLIREVLETEKLFKIAHNMHFDNMVLSRYGVGIRNVFMDTMVAHHNVFQDLPHGLDFLTSIYTWEPYYKDDRTMVDFIGSQIDADDYSCKDAAVTLELVNPLVKELEAYGIEKFFFTRMMDRVKAVSEMQRHGLPVDEDHRLELRRNAEENLDREEVILKELLGINPHSPKQVCSFLYDKDKLGLGVIKKRKTQNRTSDDDAMRQLVQRYPEHKETLFSILNARKYRKEISTYLDAVQEDGKFMYSVNINGTVQGRVSIGQLIDGSGIPAQGIPKKLRYMIVPPDPDQVIWEVDSKQGESMIVTWIAGEDLLFNAFRDKKDTHQIMGSYIFNCEVEEVVGSKREVAKTIRHATNYRIGPRQLMIEVNNNFPDYRFSFGDAKRVIQLLKEVNPKTQEWGDRIEESVRAGNRILRNCWGRMRMLLMPFNQELVRSAISFEPQSTLGDLALISLGDIQREFGVEGLDPERNYTINLVHDSIVGVCERGNIEKVREIVVRCMEQELPGLVFKGVKLKIPAEFKIGDNWRDLHEQD